MNSLTMKKIALVFLTMLFLGNQATAMQLSPKNKYEALLSFADEHKGKIALATAALAGIGITYKCRHSLSTFFKNRFFSKEAGNKTVEEKSSSLYEESSSTQLDMLPNNGSCTINIENDCGNIEIKRENVPFVTLLISKKSQLKNDLSRLQPEINQEDSSFKIKTRKIAPLVSAAWCHYQITIPHAHSGILNFKAQTDAGNITAKGINGYLISISNSGQQNIDGINGETSIRSGSGPVIVRNIERGPLRVNSERGDIDAHNNSEAYLNTEQGNIKISKISGQVSALGGTISMEADHFSGNLSMMAKGSITLTAQSMDIKRLITHAPQGKILCDFPVQSPEYRGDKLLHCKIGNDGNVVDLLSCEGDIFLKKKE